MKFKFKKSDWVVFVVLLIVLFVVFMWCLDISISAIASTPCGQTPTVTNGWSEMNASTTYHVGLYGMFLTMFLLCIVAVHHILKEEDKK
jgi:hypothetical protein